MTKRDMEELANGLEALGDLERNSGCSDRFFRQVFTQKIRAILAGGYIDKLRNSANDDKLSKG